MDAIFSYARDHLSYPDLLEKGLGPHKVNELLLFNTDKPNYRVDITATFKLKLETLVCHYSQINEMGGETEKKIREWSRQLAKGEEYEPAEAFNRVDMWW